MSVNDGYRIVNEASGVISDTTIWRVTLESSIMILEVLFDYCNMLIVQVTGKP